MSALKAARARQTGTLVEVWRTEEFGLDPDDGGPYLTVCEHGNNVQHQTRKDAMDWSAEPAMWCPECADALEAKLERLSAR